MDGVIRRGPAGAAQPRPAQAQPSNRPRPQEAPVPAPRPAQHRAAAPQPAPMQQRPQASRQQPAPQRQDAQSRPVRKSRGRNGVKVFFQTLLALVVILGVAVAIVVLYLRYYQ